MSSKWRRFELLLPLRFNDGTEVPGLWIADAVMEIVDRFDAASYETQKVEGHWRSGQIMYRDELVKVAAPEMRHPPRFLSVCLATCSGAPLGTRVCNARLLCWGAGLLAQLI
jgi:hypothetical protein